MLAVWIMVLVSCEPGSIEEETDTGTILNEAMADGEYIELAVNGEQFSISDPGKIFAEVQTNVDSGVTSLVLAGEIGENELVFLLVVCFFDGPGTYITGTRNTMSGTELYMDGQVWLCSRSSRDPGMVLITSADEHFIEGNFKIRGFNSELKNYVVQEGEFRVERREFRF